MSEILIIVQVRTGSSRLPGKVCLPLLEHPVFIHQIQRIQSIQTPHKLVVATTNCAEDDQIESICNAYQIECFRGDALDLLDRHYQCARTYQAKFVSKIPSDCPLIDPKCIDRVFQYFLQNSFDYVSNLHPASYPDGNDVEVFTFQALETAFKEAKRPLEREHTTPFIWENPDRFSIGNVVWENAQNASKSLRLTLDYKEDYLLIQKIYEALYPQNKLFSLTEIIAFLNENPSIRTINEQYLGQFWYNQHLNELQHV